MDPQRPRPEVDLLTQQDIEHLLAQVSTDAGQATIRRIDGTKETYAPEDLRRHDFRAPTFFAPGPRRQLELAHGDLVTSLEARLANFLRLELSLRVARLETRSCAELLSSLSEPTHLTLFRIDPWKGMCLCEIEPHLGLSFVDRLLGGSGKSSSVDRYLTEIETALLDQVLNLILSHWCQHWAKVQDLHPSIIGHESSPQYVELAAPGELFLLLVIEARLGDCLEELKLAFPCVALEPLIRQMAPPRALSEKQSPRAAAPKPRWNPALDRIEVSLGAEWPTRQLSAREISRLQVGDVVAWDPTAASQVLLRVSEKEKFTGRLGTRHGRWAIEITGRTETAKV